MYNSILQFIQNDINEIEKNVREILDGTKDAADLSNDIHERVLKLGSRIVGEIYEQSDEAPKDSTHHRYRLTGKHIFCGVYNCYDNNYNLNIKTT